MSSSAKIALTLGTVIAGIIGMIAILLAGASGTIDHSPACSADYAGILQSVGLIVSISYIVIKVWLVWDDKQSTLPFSLKIILNPVFVFVTLTMIVGLLGQY